MMKHLIRLLTIWLSASSAYAIDTYFPGDGPPTSADVETTPEPSYPPQQAQPNPEDEPYNDPSQESNPDASNANPE